MIQRSLILAVGLAASAAFADAPSFNRDVRPILSENCYGCHGPDKNHRKAGLRLDTFAGATADHDGVRAIVPGDLKASELVARILETDPDEIMPPPESHKELEPAEIRILQDWIKSGAEYQAHWAFVPVAEIEPPNIPGHQHPVDRLVAAELKKSNRQFADSADRITALRRLSFDLIGLPPTKAEVDAFVADTSPDAWQKQVDRLLSSPHFGEHLAVYWLDLVRYADTVGYHGDQERSIWPYRDWVIAALNANMPFDQFTREQLAGDLLPNPTIAQKVASGYNRLNMVTAEGGAQPAEYRAIYNADRVRNVSEAFMGATIGCAQCHDHKFDPYTMKDFYSLAAFFADVTERDVYNGSKQPGDWGPHVRVIPPDLQEKLAALEAKIAAADAHAKAKPGQTAVDAWATANAEQFTKPIWSPQVPVSATSSNAKVKLQADADAVIAAVGPSEAKEDYVVELNPSGWVTGVQLEVLPDGNGKVGRGNGNIVMTTFTLARKSGDKTTPLAIAGAKASYEQPTFPVRNALNNKANSGWAIGAYKPEMQGKAQQAVFTLKQPLEFKANDRLIVTARHQSQHAHHHPGQFRLSTTHVAKPQIGDSVPAELRAAFATAPAQRTPAHKDLIRNAYSATLKGAVADLQAERDQIAKSNSQLSMTTVALANPRTVRILNRGDWMDTSGEVVQPNTPEFLPPLQAKGERANRLDLANWLTAPENPLTSRALANRLWARLFGAGLSRDLSDLGNQGQWPTHPELLDYLADYLVDNDWDVKQFIRHVVTSRTYQQSSIPTPELAEKDPYNKLLARQSRYRVPAEVVRDNALALSGLLVREVGGPNARPYQPAGYYANLNFPRRRYAADQGKQQYRRGVYTHWQRTFLHPAMLAFDAPTREECTAQRTRSNTPLQALNLLNDPTMVEASRALAERVMLEGGAADDERARWLWGHALSRPPTAAEFATLMAYHNKQLETYQGSPEAAAALLAVGQKPVNGDLPPQQLAAWTVTSRLLLNLHETIMRN